MKTIKNLILIIAIIALIFSGCKKKTSDSESNANLVGIWEFEAVNNLNQARYYQMEIHQSASALSGEAALRVGSTRQFGVISGNVAGGTVNLTATFGSASYSFGFTASVTPGAVPSSIHGTLHWTPELKAGADIVSDVYVCRSSVKIHCDTLPNNAYKFIKVLSTPSPTGPPVIFVHGMDATMKCWDTLIMNLSADFKLRHNVYEFQYNWKDSITINGRALRDSVVAAGLVSPILIGHSMGGLVSRAYIASGGNITKLVTLGTPHLGTPLVQLIDLFCFANFPGPRQMYPCTGFIPDMLHNALDIANRSKYWVIAGQMTDQLDNTAHYQWLPAWAASIDRIGYDAFLLFGPPPNDGLVPVNSANFDTLNVPVNRPLPLQQWVDHFNLIKPDRAPQILQFINSL